MENNVIKLTKNQYFRFYFYFFYWFQASFLLFLRLIRKSKNKEKHATKPLSNLCATPTMNIFTTIHYLYIYLHLFLRVCVYISYLFFALCTASCHQNDTEKKEMSNEHLGKSNIDSQSNHNTNKTNNDNNIKLVSEGEKSAKNKDIEPKTKENPKNTKQSNVQKLLEKLRKDPQTKIQFAPLDNQILSSDTLFKVQNNIYEINYATSSANDSLVAQEMSDIQQRKVILLSHNYQTDIAFRINGRGTAKKTIKKELFNNKIERDFLEKSIIKHPQFIRFDEAKNEAIFEFIIGVPNTDWLVIAAVNLSPQGSFRIIDIMMPEM